MIYMINNIEPEMIVGTENIIKAAQRATSRRSGIRQTHILDSQKAIDKFLKQQKSIVNSKKLNINLIDNNRKVKSK